MEPGTVVSIKKIQGEQPWAGDSMLWNRRPEGTGTIVKRWPGNVREAYEVRHTDDTHSVYWREELTPVV